MADNYLRLYVHLVWKTWDGLPLITPEVRAKVYPVLLGKARETDCAVHAVGGFADHVHLLISLRPAVSLSEVIKEMKGASSRVVGLEWPERFFKWQGSYGAISVSPWDLAKVTRYIENQERHHARGDCKAVFEMVTEADEL